MKRLVVGILVGSGLALGAATLWIWTAQAFAWGPGSGAGMLLVDAAVLLVGGFVIKWGDFS